MVDFFKAGRSQPNIPPRIASRCEASIPIKLTEDMSVAETADAR